MRKPKQPRRRGQRESKNNANAARKGAEAIAAAMAIAAGTQAYGAPVRYDNSGVFDWSDGGALDVTLPDFIQQFGDPAAPSSFLLEQAYQPMYYTYGYPVYYPHPGYALSTLTGAQPGSEALTYWGYTDALDAGEMIGDGSGDWDSPSRLVYDFIYYQHYDYSALPIGQQTYIGVRFNQLDGAHYGWINLERVGFYGLDFEVYAWGYETSPDTPIAAGALPEPGTLGLLAFGFVAAAARRRNV